MPPQVIDFRRAKSHIFKEFEGLLKAGSHQEISLLGHTADKKLERRAPLEVGLEVSRGHRQLVQIREQAGHRLVRGHGHIYTLLSTREHDRAPKRGTPVA